MNSPAYWGEQAKALARRGAYPQAEAALRVGLGQHPGHPVLGYALAILLLARGDYAAGWPLYEQRSRLPGARRPRVSFPEWDGGDVGSLLILPEQGFGDQIMFARFIPPLRARGIRVTLIATPAMARLYRRLDVEVLVVDGAVDLPRRDAWSLIGSLAGRLGALPPPPPSWSGDPGEAGASCCAEAGGIRIAT